MNPLPPRHLNPFSFNGEIFFSSIIIILCIIIFFKTKEAFLLTKHKGIEYFRYAFLFLGLSYLIRLSLRFITRMKLVQFEQIRQIIPLNLFLVGYVSTLAILYLFFSSSWKEFNQKYTHIIIHSSALILGIIATILHNPLTFVFFQGGLLIATTYFLLKQKKKKLKQKKKSYEIGLIYTLLIIFWIISLSPLQVRRFVPIEFVYIIQPLSVIIFGVIFYKVSKWLKW